MKQYTTPEQTAKLIELGFKKPKCCSGFSVDETKDIVFYYDYSIGELIEMLPMHYATGVKWFELAITYSVINSGWIVGGTRNPKDNTYGTELIDALYDMCIKLKEEGII